MNDVDRKVFEMSDKHRYGPDFIAWWNRLAPRDRVLVTRNRRKIWDYYVAVDEGAIRFWLTGSLQ